MVGKCKIHGTPMKQGGCFQTLYSWCEQCEKADTEPVTDPGFERTPTQPVQRGLVIGRDGLKTVVCPPPRGTYYIVPAFSTAGGFVKQVHVFAGRDGDAVVYKWSHDIR